MIAPRLRPCPDLGLARALADTIDLTHWRDAPGPSPRPDAAPPELIDWLGEAGVAQLCQHWDERAVRVGRAGAALGPIADLDTFFAWLELHRDHVVRPCRDQGGVRFAPAEGPRPELSYRAELWRLFGALEGSPVVSALERFTGSVAKDFWFYSPPRTSSLPLHVDEQDNLVVQVVGTKRWTLYPRSRTRPVFGLGKMPVDEGALDPATATRVTLEPGDVLLLPRGVPHRAKAEDGASLHLDLNLVVPTALHEHLLAAWRQAHPAWSEAIDTATRPLGTTTPPPPGPAMSPAERRFWWTCVVASDVDRRIDSRCPDAPLKLRMGMGTEVDLGRRWIPTHVDEGRARFYAHGAIYECDEEEREVIDSLRAGLPLCDYQRMRGRHMPQCQLLEAAGWIRCR